MNKGKKRASHDEDEYRHSEDSVHDDGAVSLQRKRRNIGTMRHGGDARDDEDTRDPFASAGKSVPSADTSHGAIVRHQSARPPKRPSAHDPVDDVNLGMDEFAPESPLPPAKRMRKTQLDTTPALPNKDISNDRGEQELIAHQSAPDQRRKLASGDESNDEHDHDGEEEAEDGELPMTHVCFVLR